MLWRDIVSDMRLLLTDKSVARLAYAGEKQYRVRDTELRGFCVLVGKRRKSFIVQGEFWRHGVREFAAQMKVGVFGEISTREARSKARGVLGSIARGQRPGGPVRASVGVITLRQAWQRYRDAHMIRQGRSARTIESYRDHMERLFGDWLDKPLARLGHQPNLVVERHDAITDRHGPYIANGSMRSLRAVYNHARKSNPSLPAVNPVTAIDWNKERRRNTGMGFSEIGDWLKELSALANPIRREFHLLTLLSGSRPAALKNVRITDIDVRRRLMRILRPKGGEEKAFEIPLSRPMMRSIIRVIRVGRIVYPAQAKTWLFPADSKFGNLAEHKEERQALSKWGNDLRQSYRTVAQAVGISELDVHLLMNHSLPGVNAGYITRDRLLLNHLRDQQQRISEAICRIVGKGDNCPELDWIFGAKAYYSMGADSGSASVNQHQTCTEEHLPDQSLREKMRARTAFKPPRAPSQTPRSAITPALRSSNVHADTSVTDATVAVRCHRTGERTRNVCIRHDASGLEHLASQRTVRRDPAVGRD
jgi:site-specific recombinase XerD